METITIIGIDIAKNVFHLHGASADGEVMFRTKLTRAKLLTFVEKQPPLPCGNGGLWRRIQPLHHLIETLHQHED